MSVRLGGAGPDGATAAEARLNGTGIKCFVTGGNDDEWDVLSAMKREGTKSFIACENEMVMVDDDHSMISVGISTPTPWKTPREVSEEELGRMIEEMAAKVPDMNKAIFNFHDPPKDSTLDTCPMLDRTKDPPEQIVQGGQPVMHGAGSHSVRAAIEKYKRCSDCTATFTSHSPWRRSGEPLA